MHTIDTVSSRYKRNFHFNISYRHNGMKHKQEKSTQCTRKRQYMLNGMRGKEKLSEFWEISINNQIGNT